jgi:hypothetical protein
MGEHLLTSCHVLNKFLTRIKIKPLRPCSAREVSGVLVSITQQGLGENNSCREVSARPGGNFSNNMGIREIQKNRQCYRMCRSEIAGMV